MVNSILTNVTVYAAGPMTDLALAIALDPRFAEFTKRTDPSWPAALIRKPTIPRIWRSRPSENFNFWMDPEASRAVLHARWPRLVLTSVDISVKTRMEKIIDRAGPEKPNARAQ